MLFAYSIASRWAWAPLSWLHHSCCRFFHKQKLCFMNTFTLAPAGVSLRTRALENTTATLQKYRMQMTVFRLVVWFTRGSTGSAGLTQLRHWCGDQDALQEKPPIMAIWLQRQCKHTVRSTYRDSAIQKQLVGTHRRCQTSDDRRCKCYVWFKAINPHDRQGGIIVLAPCARRPAWRPSKATRGPASLVEGVYWRHYALTVLTSVAHSHNVRFTVILKLPKKFSVQPRKIINCKITFTDTHISFINML